jgi:hypothetical protein
LEEGNRWHKKRQLLCRFCQRHTGCQCQQRTSFSFVNMPFMFWMTMHTISARHPQSATCTGGACTHPAYGGVLAAGYMGSEVGVLGPHLEVVRRLQESNILKTLLQYRWLCLAQQPHVSPAGYARQCAHCVGHLGMLVYVAASQRRASAARHMVPSSAPCMRSASLPHLGLVAEVRHLPLAVASLLGVWQAAPQEHLQRHVMCDADISADAQACRERQPRASERAHRVQPAFFTPCGACL